MKKTLTLISIIVGIMICAFAISMFVGRELTDNETYTPYLEDSKYCVSDNECVCDGHYDNQCFMGNIHFYSKYVYLKNKTCPDFCTGLDGAQRTACVSNQCTQVDIASCDVDSDCVRQTSCCDCGLGRYVNKKFQVQVECEYVCKCAIQNSVGKCENNMCVAVAG